MSGLLEKGGARGLEQRMCTRELYNMGITSTKEEAEWFSGGKGWFPLVSGEEGLVLGGFRVGRTGFEWFQGGKDWFQVVSCGKDWFWVVSARSAF